ncbi:ABC transporter ATP-binding protein [Tepidimicrobium xylanilyticum]|uniref:ABC-2 type transport system ATP-binding protein n=1 Tax=Tepidimicrobium xylanilyticum TaxID=1123352 RepID=A0A1H3ATZ8_9FIRM|nr:ABC transporter ATP-binding protein [Tepidimicrobium xylanilyticum]NLW41324.1 ABC transporter ATP-binding protein [Tissierellia bacterium]GMG97660.1 ABC transporter ATP-binding protein [Tepidimicrobium xylanilyticum]SDX33166.1 ABC-2 type transport system ATP-binding protein [Tepidimicrobium xylanilyticum]
MVVKVKNLVKRYKEIIALDHFNMEVDEGEVLGLLGPNGCGKTTAINCILSLLSFDKGEIEVFGKKMSPDAYDIKRQIGLVPQEVSVFGNLTVRENIDYFCGLYIYDKNLRRRFVDEAIEFVDLKDYVKFYPKKLSGGLKRRLNIACGIVHKPKLIFLDEPTVAVDAQSRNFILNGIKQLNEEGSTIIYTTHYLEEAEMLCKRIIIMDNGKDLVSGTKEELKAMITTSEKIIVSFSEIRDETVSEMKKLPHVIDIEKDGDDYMIKFENGFNNLTNLLEFIKEKELTYTKLHSQLPTLNDVFLELTGKELRD